MKKFFKVCFAAMVVCIAWISPFGAVELYTCFRYSRGRDWQVAAIGTIVGYPFWIVASIITLLYIAIVAAVAPVKAIYYKARHGTKMKEIINIYVDRIINAFDLEGYGNLNVKEALSRL